MLQIKLKEDELSPKTKSKKYRVRLDQKNAQEESPKKCLSNQMFKCLNLMQTQEAFQDDEIILKHKPQSERLLKSVNSLKPSEQNQLPNTTRLSDQKLLILQNQTVNATVFSQKKYQCQNKRFCYFKYLLIFTMICGQIKQINVSAALDCTFLIDNSYQIKYLSMSSDHKTVYAFSRDVIKIFNFINSNLTIKQTIYTNLQLDLNYDQVQLWNDGAKIFIVGYLFQSTNTYILIYDYDPLTGLYKTNPGQYQNISISTTAYILSIQVNNIGDLLLVSLSNEPNIARRYLFNGISWNLSPQPLTHGCNSNSIRLMQFAQSDTRLIIYDQSNNKLYTAQIKNGTQYNVLSMIGLTVTWIVYKPYECKLSKDEKFISCFHIGHQYTNYMMNWLNNNHTSVVKQADSNVIFTDTFIDMNQMYTVLDQTNKKLLKYQLTVSGSSFTYSLNDWLTIPDYPQLIASQSSSKFQILSTSNRSIYLIKNSCSNTLINCISCQKDNNTRCAFCSQQYQLQNGTCLNCASGYYKSGSICISCAINLCKTCNSTNCNQCMTGYTLSSNACSQCSIGYYNSSNKCLSCSSNCLSCVSSLACTQCKNGFFVSNGICVQCPLVGCSLCLNTTHCSNCNLGYTKYGVICCSIGTLTCDSSGISSSCDTGYYLLSQKCIACLSNCDVCSDSATCTTCSTGWKSTGGQICNSCDLKYYSSASSCLPCSANCEVCSDSATCTTCKTGYKLYQNKCDSCQNGYFSFSNECQPCNSNCSTCNDSTNCLTCKDSTKTLSTGCTTSSNSLQVKLSVTNLQNVSKQIVQRIPNCEVYQLLEQTYSCRQCRSDSEVRSNVLRNSTLSNQCVLKSVILNSGLRCTVYQSINSTHACSSCRQYYRLIPVNVNGTTVLTCVYKYVVIITPYCERYTWNTQQKTHICQKCENPNDTLIPLLVGKTTLLTCVMTFIVSQIPNCYSYRYYVGRFYCLSCSIGYVFDINKNCNECAANYTKSTSSGKVLCTQN